MYTSKLLIVLAILLWTYFLWSRRKFYMLMLKMSGPKGFPLVGEAYKVRGLEDVLSQVKQIFAAYGSPFLTWIGPYPVLGVCDSQTTQDILTSPHCLERAFPYDVVGDALGNGLLSLHNPAWSAHRKLLTPAFSHDVILSFVPIFNTECTFLTEFLDELLDSGPFNIIPLLHKLTLNIATQTTMGKNLPSTRNWRGEKEELFEYYKCVLAKVTELTFKPWLRLQWLQRILPSFVAYRNGKREIRKYVDNLICEKLEASTLPSIPQLEPLNGVSSDELNPKRKHRFFIDIAMDLLKSGKFNRTDVIEHCNNIIFGAFETTAITIAHTLMHLAMFPQYQELAYEEIHALLADRDNQQVSYEDSQQMNYLEMVINESMRLLPTVPIIGRKTSSNVRLSNGIVIPEGVQIGIDLYHLHRLESIWGPQAHVFNPDNFLSENISARHPYGFVPFLKGRRNCLGWSYGMIVSKITLAILLHRYSFSTTYNYDDMRFAPEVTSRLINPPLLQLHLREK